MKLIKVIKIILNKHSEARMSKELKTSFIKYSLFSFILSFIDNIMALSVQAANFALNNNYKYIAVIFIVIYLIRDVVYESLSIIEASLIDSYNDNIDVEIPRIFTKILSIVRGKVYINDKYKTKKSDSVVSKEIMGFLDKLLDMSESLVQMVGSIIIIIVLFICTFISTLGKIDNLFFAIMLIFTISYIVISIRENSRNKEYYKETRKINKEIENARNDFVNIMPCSEDHSIYTRDRYIRLNNDLRKKSRKIRFKTRKESILSTIIMSIAAILLGMNQIYMSGGIENLNSKIMLDVIANVGIYMILLNKIASLVSRIKKLNDKCNIFIEYYPDFDYIMSVYDENILSKRVDFFGRIDFSPFKFMYQDENENEVYSLQSNKKIIINSGEPILLVGPSGSGKTTFINLLVGNIKSDEILVPNCNNYFNRADTLMGTDNILNEITLENNVIKEKLLFILNGLNLMQELLELSNNSDIIEFLAHKYYSDFSEGQRQRLVLARMLYNIYNCDIVVVDEPTANLDGINSEIVIKFLCDYVNLDKKRILIIATHDVEEGMKSVKKVIKFEKLYDKKYLLQ